MSLDPPFIPEIAEPGFLAPVPGGVAAAGDRERRRAGALRRRTWDGKLVSVPFWANTQLLWYRKSVAKAAGLDPTAPVTWDQIIDAAADQDKYLGVQGQRASRSPCGSTP